MDPEVQTAFIFIATNQCPMLPIEAFWNPVAKTAQVSKKPIQNQITKWKRSLAQARKKRQWPQRHFAEIKESGLDLSVIEAKAMSPEFLPGMGSNLCIRVRHLLAIKYAQAELRGEDLSCRCRIFQVDQNSHRCPSGAEGLCPCITPKGVFWATHLGRALDSSELWALQGLSMEEQQKYSLLQGAKGQDLAGNALSLPVALLVVIGGLLTLSSD